MHYEPEFNNKKRNPLTPNEAKLKAADYCAYQERSQQEVRDKLYDYGLHQDEVDEVLSELIVEGFVNEERFAIAYAGGKFRVKKWGKVKILQGLKHHKISEYCIKQGLKEIDDADYKNVLVEILNRKAPAIKASNDYERNTKLARFAISRGFEPELVWKVIKEN